MEGIDALPESTMYVVTFSGVTSGGMVTSGTTCCTCGTSVLGQCPRQCDAQMTELTRGTNDSLIREVTMVLFPTPSVVVVVGYSHVSVGLVNWIGTCLD